MNEKKMLISVEFTQVHRSRNAEQPAGAVGALLMSVSF